MNSRRSALNSSRSRCSDTSAKMKFNKKPEWDSTISDLNSYKPTAEELERRRIKMQTKSRPTGKVDVYSRLYSNAANANGGDNTKEKNFIQNMFCDESSFWEAIAKSDKALSVVQDLFGDTAKHSRQRVNQLPPKHRGLPRVTQAPLSANSDTFFPPTSRSRQKVNQLSRSEEKESSKSQGKTRYSDGKLSKVNVTLPSEEPELKTNLDHISAAVTKAAALNDSSVSSNSDDNSFSSESSESEDSNSESRFNRRRRGDSSSKFNRKHKDSQRSINHSKTTDELRRFKEFLAHEKRQDKLEQENHGNSLSRPQIERQNRPVNRNNNFRRTPEHNPDNESIPSPSAMNVGPNGQQNQSPLEAAHAGLIEGHRLRSERRHSSSSRGSSKDAWCSAGAEASRIPLSKLDTLAPVRHLVEQLEKEALTQRPLNPEENNNERIRQAVSQLRIVSMPNEDKDEMTKLSHRMIAALKRLLSEKDHTIQDLDSQIKKLRELIDVLTMELISTNEKADKLAQNFNDYKQDTDAQISRLKSLVYSQMGIKESERYSRLTSQSISNSSSQASNRACDQFEAAALTVDEHQEKSEAVQLTLSTPKVAEVAATSGREEADIEHSLVQSRLKSFIKLPVPVIRSDFD